MIFSLKELEYVAVLVSTNDLECWERSLVHCTWRRHFMFADAPEDALPSIPFEVNEILSSKRREKTSMCAHKSWGRDGRRETRRVGASHLQRPFSSRHTGLVISASISKVQGQSRKTLSFHHCRQRWPAH